MYIFIGSDYLKYLQWIKELNLEGPQVPKFLVGTMADMKNAERDKGKDIPTKRFARIICIIVDILSTNCIFNSEVQKIVKDLNFVTSMECR